MADNKKTRKSKEVEVITIEQIKNIFTEQFKTHEENIKLIICSNTKILNDRMDLLTTKINDLQESVEFTQKHFEEKIVEMEDKFIAKTNKIEEELLNIKVNHVSKKVIDHISQKLVEIEDRSRRNNIRIDGIPESYKESWDDCEKKVQNVFTNRLGIENVEIERAHRVAGVMKEGTEENNDRRRPRTIVLKLLSYKDKVKIFRNANKLKDSGIYINEDYCKETTDKRKELWNEVKRLREQGKYAVIRYNKIVQNEFKR